MNKKALALTFYLLLILFVISSVTGAFFDLHYYPGGKRFLRHIHIYLSYVTLIFTFIHLYLNKGWIKGIWGKVQKLAKQSRAMGYVFYLLLINFVLVNVTGIALHLHYLFLPKGWYRPIKHIHDYTGYILMVFALIHLYQNRKYIVNLFKNRK